jgi:chromosomal replication initiation ATPase DnaA
MNDENIGSPIFKVIKTEKNTRNKKKKYDPYEPKECPHCYKIIKASNMCKHYQACPMKKIGLEKDSKVVYAHLNDKSIKNYFEEFTVSANEKIQHIPNRKQERDILYITGRSGSGKSYYCMQWANEYHKMYPKNPIYLFSALSEDKGSIDKVKGLQRVKLTPEFYNAEILLDDLANSLLIFDDIDVMIDKPMLQKLYGILNSVLQTGRHKHISCIYTTHTPTNGQQTKIILAESHSVTLFVHGMGGRSLNYLLESYYGLDKEQIKKIKGIQSRWVTITRTYPSICFHDTGAFKI